MYYDEPGDAVQQDEEIAAERAEAIAEAQQGGDGELTMDRDTRRKGPGVI